MEEVGCWSTYYKDAYGHGESKMEFYHCHGGGWLLVASLDAHVQGGDQDGALTLRMEEVGCLSTYKMPMPTESPRLSFEIIREEVGCWSTCKMPVPMESQDGALPS